ncbi:hypothetical protein CDAR_496941 [Caerostris darwini]|uniref:Uncharacterized protein n=1 Tax=Caerostris darwini TaxID=1538125 RepID=A0AAV4S013_9ARAC|nr:hypothetical protein CDAR_496941 [Caerostris darwini]
MRSHLNIHFTLNNLLLHYPEACESWELEFALQTVTFIVNRYCPFWKHPDATGSPEHLTQPIRKRIKEIRREYIERFQTRFKEEFPGPKTSEVFSTYALNKRAFYIEMEYDLDSLFRYCVEVSEFAAYMYRAGCIEAPEIAVNNIFLYLWHSRKRWNGDIYDVGEPFKMMDTHCRRLSESKKV